MRPGLRAQHAAGWIAEALSTGNPLAALPLEIAPRGRREGERVALLALDALAIAPCGLRVAGDVAGPVIEARLLPDGANLPPLRHPVVTAALVGVLREALVPGAEDPPALASLHAALDISDHRFTQRPSGRALQAADLGGLGFIILGPPCESPPEVVTAGSQRIMVQKALAPVAEAARRLGGLPAGALLVAAGLSPPLFADAAGRITLGFGVLGPVAARLA
jgi:hypothetical protein